MTVAGTTDAISEVTFSPKPRNSDIEFILSEIRGYLNQDITGNFFNIMKFDLKNNFSTSW
jgi:glycerol-3-phosphate dehydrogenase